MRVQALSEYVAGFRGPRGRDAVLGASVPYLVETGTYKPPSDPPIVREGYRTGELDLDQVRARHLTLDQRQVYALQKRPGSAFPELISVGRAPNVDVHLARNGISKLHAHFTRDGRGIYCVTDRDSTNGTFVNGVRLGPAQTIEVDDGSEVRFASYCFRLMSPERFARLLDGLIHGR